MPEKRRDPHEVMTLPEAAEYLRISKSTLYALAQRGEVPCKKVGRRWRFSRNALDRWLQEDGTEAVG